MKTDIRDMTFIIPVLHYSFSATMLEKLKAICVENHVLYAQFGERKWFQFDPPDKEDYVSMTKYG